MKTTIDETLDIKAEKNDLRPIIDVLDLHIKSIIDLEVNEGDFSSSVLRLETYQFDMILQGLRSSNLYKLIERLSLSHDDLALVVFAYAWENYHEIFTPFFIHGDNVSLHAKYQGHLESTKKRFTPSFHTFLTMYYPDSHWVMYNYFTDPQHPLIKNAVITFESVVTKGDVLGVRNKVVKLSENFLVYLNGGGYPPLDSEVGFPANLTTSKMDFEEVVLTSGTLENLEPFVTWLRICQNIKQQKDQPFFKKIKTNKMYVFAGSPGTGKTLTATTFR
ncbi:hypothetical protein [Flammeovirga aprica]|uniref:Uncharacterized protein n=1 Tax=Flammeovirga aprica JL-4 TaxID=694437 RepID=A0A7X9RV60_9BACT|nr:hypothetical protein [Flammeovirga aprica]NME69302.1 hypothetical protein [Flammeovirga aprica JL-4]